MIDKIVLAGLNQTPNHLAWCWVEPKLKKRTLSKLA